MSYFVYQLTPVLAIVLGCLALLARYQARHQDMADRLMRISFASFGTAGIIGIAIVMGEILRLLVIGIALFYYFKWLRSQPLPVFSWLFRKKSAQPRDVLPFRRRRA